MLIVCHLMDAGGQCIAMCMRRKGCFQKQIPYNFQAAVFFLEGGGSCDCLAGHGSLWEGVICPEIFMKTGNAGAVKTA